ncbi:MAG: PQQ-dependent sugar dehydrogenase [Planctomycetota bacterium]|nr:PQQ-dependent sugar dehydrogenase [Planctomycetota bacterium]MDA1248912.1 PQQ-dependent sugar dehydrogenase [Planctomycetota bacterium]
MRWIHFAAVVAAIHSAIPLVARSADPAQTYATGDRALWTTSNVVGSPDPPAKYVTEVAFSNLKFDEPLAFAVVPELDRIGIAERYGKIFTFPNELATKDRTLLLELKRTVMGLAFHPEFASNGKFYVTSLPDPGTPTDKGTRVSEFLVSDRSKMTADPGSERILIEWPNGGHNGGCLRFGPDGFLYLATGDGSGIADQRETGQDISDLFGSILRLDVDHQSGDLPYAIPKDNPFVGVANARPEIWSYGHRQIWKFSWDSADGTMWAGEVGQDLWEMVYIIQRGGNYGWSVREGRHPFRPERPKGPSEFIEPIVEHPHHDFRSITGGFVYHGTRLPELRGHYIYGDYDTGKIWALKWDAKKQTVAANFELCDVQLRAVEFGQTPDGEIFIVDFAGGQLHELALAPPVKEVEPPFPQKLSETGLFTSTAKHSPATGVIPYDVIAPLWSDHAHKDRFLAIPGASQVEFDAVTYPQPAPGSQPSWRFPDGTVLVKTFSLDMEAGNPASRQRLETRLLHHKKMDGKDNEYGAQVWRGYTYVWNKEQTDAFLLESKGLDRTYEIRDASAPGGVRKQTWHFPSRTECTLCHTMAARYVLGVSTEQMNRSFDYGKDIGRKNQIEHLNEIGVFDKAIPEAADKLRRLSDYHDSTESLASRARSYLHANCSHCHRKWGGGNADFQLLSTLPVGETGTLDVRPGQGTFELQNDPRLLVPGDPDRSLIHHRMKLLGLGRMPHIGSSVRDDESVELIRTWIKQLKP